MFHTFIVMIIESKTDEDAIFGTKWTPNHVLKNQPYLDEESFKLKTANGFEIRTKFRSRATT